MDELLKTLFGEDERAADWSVRIKAALEDGYVSKSALEDSYVSKEALEDRYIAKTALDEGYVSRAALEDGYIAKAVLDAERLEYALREAALKAGARNVKAVRALLNTEGVTLKDGEAEGVAERLDALRKSDPYLFRDATGFAGMKPAQWLGEGEKRPAEGLYEAVSKHFGRR